MAEPKHKLAPESATQQPGGIYKRGKSFLIKWREKGRQRYKTFTDEELARKALAQITLDLQAGGAGLKVEDRRPLSCRSCSDNEVDRAPQKVRIARQRTTRRPVEKSPATNVPGACGRMKVDPALIRRFVDAMLAKKMNTATVGLCVRLLSTFFTDIVEQGHVDDNPAKRLRRSTRRLYRPTHDPQDTPFLEQLAHVRAVYLALPELYGTMFAVGALGGLRTGEVLALAWEDVDLAAKRIHVHRQVRHGSLGPLKDDESRMVPIQGALALVLKAWALKTGGKGFMFRPAAPGRGKRSKLGTAFIKAQTVNDHLRAALTACELNDELTWYQATRHTFASLWVLGGGSIEKLSKILGHSDIRVTMRYAHLRVDLFTEADHRQINVDLARPEGVVIDLPPQSTKVGCTVVTDADSWKVGSTASV